MYTQFSGIYFGVQGCGAGGAPSPMGGRRRAVPVSGSLSASAGSGWEDVYYSSSRDALVLGCSLGLPKKFARSGGCSPGSREGVVGPIWGGEVPSAGWCGIARFGHFGVCRDFVSPKGRGVGKKLTSSGLRRQVSWMAGARIIRILSLSMYFSLPMSFAMRISSTGHLAGWSDIVLSSVCLSDGTKRMCPAGIRSRVDMLMWPLIALEVQGESSQVGRIITTRNGSSRCSEEAKACRTALSMSSGSYSGLAKQDPVQRYRKELIIAPKLVSSGKAEKQVIPSVIVQLRGLPNSSVLVQNVRSKAVRRGAGIAQ